MRLHTSKRELEPVPAVRQRPGVAHPVPAPTWLLSLQRVAGNAAVTELLALQPDRLLVRSPPAVQRCGPAPCGCTAEERRVHEEEPVVMRLTEPQFQSQLGSTPQQRAAIDALFANATFAALWSYLRTCAATPRQDLGPLALRVTPGLRIGGVERFGGYDPVSRTLEINPTKSEHQTNPTELVDTITHELIHAVDDLQGACVAAGSPPPPLAGAATATAPSRASVAGTPAEQQLEHDQGPGASDPCGEFIDINDAAQRIITAILRENVQVATIGRPTVTFVNVIIRRDPAAMAAFEPCRVAACGLPAGPARQSAMAHCAADTIGRFIPPDLTPALLPARIHFDRNLATIRADDLDTVDLVAIFLAAHPAVHVRLVGHTDPTGAPAFNRRLGERRAEAVRARLLAQGVPTAQIASVTSAGHLGRLSRGAATHWQDRRVEIVLAP